MTEATPPPDRAVLRGFVELFQDRFPQIPAPAAAAMAQGIFAAAGQRRWDAWPERVEFESETIELPGELHPVVDEIRVDLEERLVAGEVGAADAAVLQAIVTRLRNFPATPEAKDN